MRVRVVILKGVRWHILVLIGWVGVVIGISGLMVLPVIVVLAVLSGALIVRRARPSQRGQNALLPPAVGGLTLGPVMFWVFDGPFFVAGIALFAVGMVSWAVLAYAMPTSAISDEQK